MSRNLGPSLASLDVDDSLVALERVEISDESDGDFDYAAVSDVDTDDSDDSDDDDLDAAIRKVQQNRGASSPNSITAVTDVKPAVVDDFIRNMLIKLHMHTTLDAFNTEFYELKARGKLREEDISTVPDIYVRNQQLDASVKQLRDEITHYQTVAEKAQGTWDSFRKERDFHRMHHKRVMQEKNKLVVDLKRLKQHYENYEPMMGELRKKYEAAMKEKMLMRLERDRLAAKVDGLEAQVKSFEDASKPKQEKQEKPRRRKKGADSNLNADDTVNPFLSMVFDPPAVESYQLSKTFKGHLNAVSCVAFHPRQPVLATGSDDHTWKMWSVPEGELLMTGDGHKDWIADVAFHPHGTHLATCSGEGLIKLWDFSSVSCTATFTDHTQVAWSVDFHHSGDFVASGSMDHTAKLWDTSRQTFRGHVDAVNSVCFQPYSNLLCTTSGDKTVSLWDIRSGLCVQTFYGHSNACNNVLFNARGDTVVSCDADGAVKVWDIRVVSERGSMEGGEHALNRMALDRSGTILAAACDDTTVQLFNLDTMAFMGALRGHEDAVQDVAFDPEANMLVSCGSDNTFRVWEPSA